MANNNQDSNAKDEMLIDASATKDFFITILIRDIDLAEAIVDLVDNSVDGARKMRGDGNLNNLYVHLEISGDKFKITDNCGGIESEIARKYAFRFGRDTNDPPPTTKHSVGQFGVGMKRAIFKIGNKIKINSTAENSKFKINLDVNEWKKIPEWDLRFDELHEGEKTDEIDRGTNIEITEINQGPAQEMQLGSFKTKLKDMIQSAHGESLTKGFEIRISDFTLTGLHPELLKSGSITPVNKQITITNSTTPITVRIYAGLSTSNPAEAGWYIICNGRTILDADQTTRTGWGDTTPRYHNQYSRFRGYVYFDSDDAGLLPWNTTKTDVDSELPIYQAIRLEMINAMKPILEFLNAVDREKDLEESPLTTAVEEATSTKFEYLKLSNTFVSNVKATETKAKLARIQYQKPLKDVELVKNALGVSSLREVGEATFDYFQKMEGIE